MKVQLGSEREKTVGIATLAYGDVFRWPVTSACALEHRYVIVEVGDMVRPEKGGDWVYHVRLDNGRLCRTQADQHVVKAGGYYTDDEADNYDYYADDLAFDAWRERGR